MEKPTPPRPPGRRIYTRKMLEALARPPEIPPGITRGRAVEALRRAALELRLSHSAVALVTHLAMLTEEADWQPGMRPMAWPSNVELSTELELSRSQIKALISIAIEEGLLAVESGPSGRRFGRRDAAGDIIEAFGFNLAPLAARTPALEAMAEARSSRLREAAALRKQIGQAARIVMVVSQNAASEGLTGIDWNATFVEAQAIARRAMGPPLSGWPEGLTQALIRLEELSAAALAACATPPERIADSSAVPGPEGPDLRPPTSSASPAPPPWPRRQ